MMKITQIYPRRISDMDLSGALFQSSTVVVLAGFGFASRIEGFLVGICRIFSRTQSVLGDMGAERRRSIEVRFESGLRTLKLKYPRLRIS